jgi:HK97 family phage prohead protease
MPAIKIHHTKTSTSGWDGGANTKNLREGEAESYYRQMFAWQDPEADATIKGAYKFPHHEVNGSGDIGAANVKGCQSIISILNGGMGGAKIPSGDRKGVWDHAAAHLKDAGLTPAELNSLPLQEIEHRSFSATEIRAIAEEGQPAKISGRAAVFNQYSEDLGGFNEIILPGAFTNTLKNDDVRALLNHDSNYILGRTSSGTLKLNENSSGLDFEATPPDTQWARDMITSMQRGDLTQMSFGFRTIQDDWAMVGNKIIRTLMEVRLFDVSPVTFPAYPQTSASVRSAFEAFREGRPTEPGQAPELVEPQAEAVARAHLANLKRLLDLAEKS